MNKVIIIDDNMVDAQLIASKVNQLGYETEIEPQDRLIDFKKLHNKAKAIIIDLNLGAISGIDIVKYLRKNKINTPVLLMTGASRRYNQPLTQFKGVSNIIEVLFKDEFEGLQCLKSL